MAGIDPSTAKTGRMAGAMGVTIVQIAEEVGVSWSAVSQILNNRGRFSSETRERVLAAAARHGYRPNSSARSLRKKATKLVGVLFRNAIESPLTNMTAFEHLLGINQKFQDADLATVLIRATDISGAGDIEPRVFRERVIDGLIVVGELAEPLVQRVRALTQRIIWLDGPIWEDTCCVRRDEYAAGALCTSVMADLGYRRIHFVAREATRLSHHSHRVRERGAREAAYLRRVHLSVSNWPETNTDLEFEALSELFNTEVGVIVSTMPVARRISHCVSAMGKSPGIDFGMVCCDESDDARISWPDLSRVTFDRYRLGGHAAEMMLSLLNDPSNPPKSMLVPDQWHIGSTAWGPR